MPHPVSTWSSHSLTPLPPLHDPEWSAQGIIAIDTGQAVACLADLPRVDGYIHPTTGHARRLPLPCRGQALVFGDHTVLLVRADGTLFPAPFAQSADTPAKPSVLSRRLKALGDWGPEWGSGTPTGHLAPAFRPLHTVLGLQDEALLGQIGRHLLTLIGATHCQMEWQSQPIRRDGTLHPPTARVWGHNATTTQHRLNAALAHLWANGYPVPAIPGQTLRDGTPAPTGTDITVPAPKLSAHQQLHLWQDRDFLALKTQIQPLLA